MCVARRTASQSASGMPVLIAPLCSLTPPAEESKMEVSGKEDAVKTYSKQSRNLATIITGVGLTFFSITAEAETIGYEQSPGHFGGIFSNLADEFQLDQSAL